MPSAGTELSWDYNMEEDESDDYAELGKKALSGVIEMTEMWKLSEILRIEPGLAFEIGLTPERFPALVKSCPDLALCLLIALYAHPRRAEYWESV